MDKAIINYYHANTRAIAVLETLLSRAVVSAEDVAALLAAIPSAFDDDACAESRHSLMAIIDFSDIPAPVGRPKAKKATSRDLNLKTITAEKLIAALRAYWSGRETNNAEMGRVIALLAVRGYVSIEGNGITEAVKYFTRAVSRNARRAWNAKNVLRSYNETMALPELDFNKKVENCTKIIELLEWKGNKRNDSKQYGIIKVKK